MKNRAMVVLEEGACPFIEEMSLSCCFATFGVIV